MPKKQVHFYLQSFLRSRNSGRTYTKRKKFPSLAQGGVAAPSRKMARRHLVWRGRGGSSKLPLESIRRLNEPPRLRPAKVASRHFIDGRSHPSFAKEGNSGSFCFPRLLQIVWRDIDPFWIFCAKPK